MAHARAPLTLIVSSGLALCLAGRGFAQPVISSAESKQFAAARAPAKPAVSRIDRYAKVLNLDATQTTAARQLYEASQAQLAVSNKKMNEAMQDAQEDMNDGDSATFEKKMQRAMADRAAVVTKTTESFLADLKSLLTPDQADRWPALERYRRREGYLGGTIGLGGFGVGGSNIDLFRLVDKLTIPAEIRPKVDEQLAMYEIDIDRPLRDRQQNMESEQKQMGAVQHFDAEEFAKKQERDRTVDLAIRDVNTKYVRQIAALLPEDLAKQLTDSYQGRAYRSIYKEPSIAKKLANSQKLEDLSADQRSQLQALLDKYHRDARAANDKWAAAQVAAETAGRPTGAGMPMLGPGGSGAGQADPALTAARAARHDVDNAAREQLEKILTPDQVAAIPEPPPAPGGVMQIAALTDGIGNSMVLMDDDIDTPDDADGLGMGAPTMIISTVTSSAVIAGSPAQATSAQPPQPKSAPAPKK